MNIPNYELDKLPAVVRNLFLHWVDFMERRITFNLVDSEIHTEGHCERVLLFALLIGYRIFGDDKTALEILAQASVFHDTRRQDDYLDTGHGARAAVYYEKFCEENSDITFHPETVFLIRYHDLDDRKGEKAIVKTYGSDADRVIKLYEIFKDADALDRWRLGRRGLDPHFLRTEPAKEMVDYARHLVNETIPKAELAATEAKVNCIMEQVEKGRNDGKILLIIDPQIDFINGTLPVPGAEEAMNKLAEYIHRERPRYMHIIMTADRHPMRHCSFMSDGGQWPPHCVADSVGAAIWPAIMKELMAIADKVTIVHKGENPDTEEYSILKNAYSTLRIKRIIRDENIRSADICGLAGDVCVADTIRDWLKYELKVKLNVLTKFSPSINGGKTLYMLISKYGLSCDR